jgi:hypothetical protein
MRTRAKEEPMKRKTHDYGWIGKVFQPAVLPYFIIAFGFLYPATGCSLSRSLLMSTSLLLSNGAKCHAPLNITG